LKKEKTLIAPFSSKPPLTILKNNPKNPHQYLSEKKMIEPLSSLQPIEPHP